jgi:transposase
MQNTKNLVSINNIKERTVKTESHEEYDHYIAIDWSQTNMAIARMSKSSKGKIKITECPTSIKRLKEQLKTLRGSKILTIEESSPAQWLYVELHDCVDRIIICDPYVNKLLSDGAKNDPIDAKKLCLLLKGGLLRPVYHSTEELYSLRRLMSSYEDLIKQITRLKNQKAGFLLQKGKSKKTNEMKDDKISEFILIGHQGMIAESEKLKKEYQKEIIKRCRKDNRLKYMQSIPGVGIILASKILAITVDPGRFNRVGKYLAYSGLVKHLKVSGGRIYGKRNTRFNRILKSAFKTAAVIAIKGSNPIREYYEYLINNGLPDYNARHKVARYIARLCFGIMKNPGRYNPYLWRKNLANK